MLPLLRKLLSFFEWEFKTRFRIPINRLQARAAGQPAPSRPPATLPAADFHWLPTAEMLGSSPTEVAVRLLAVLPVISLSFICQ